MLNIKQKGNGIIFELEPGDSTRYTLLIADTGDELFVAIGTGDTLEGGYPILKHNLTVKPDIGFVRYWKDHTKIRNEWTAAVAVLAAYLFYNNKLVQGSTFIHDCYRECF